MRSQQRDATRLAIVDATIDCLVEDGYAALTTRRVAERAGRMFWLNPEPRLYWNYGDSVMAAYERYCTTAFECWTTRHLENFVNVVAGGTPLAEQG